MSIYKKDLQALVQFNVQAPATHVAVQAAIDAAVAAGGGKVKLSKGTFTFSAEVTRNDHVGNVVIEGSGPETRVVHDGSYDGALFFLSCPTILTGGLNINNTTAGNTSVTFTTAAQAGNILAGDLFSFTGTDVDGILDVEMHYAAANGNAMTGVVTLLTPVLRTMTSVTTFATTNIRSKAGNAIRDMSIILNAAPATKGNGIHIDKWQSSEISNIYATEGWNLSPSTTTDAPIIVWDSAYTNVVGCKVISSNNNGIFFSSPIECRIINCDLINCALVASNSYGAIKLQNCSEISIEGCNIEGAGNSAAILYLGSNPNRRSRISNCFIAGGRYRGIELSGQCHEFIITENVIERVVTEYGLYLRNGGHVVSNNIFLECAFPIYQDLTTSKAIIVTANKIINSGSYAIFLQSNVGSIISNNTIQGGLGGSSAIYLDQMTDASITGNTIQDITGKGIHLVASSRCSVVGNVMRTISSNAIFLDATSNDNIVKANQADGFDIVNNGLRNKFDFLTSATKTANYTTQAEDIIYADTAGGNFTVTLSTADLARIGEVKYIKNIGANNCIIDTQGAELIDGAASITIVGIYTILKVVSDGTNWTAL
jgi:parallel beta-helix repeat protein